MPPSARTIVDKIEPEAPDYPRPELPGLRDTVFNIPAYASLASVFSLLSLRRTFMPYDILSWVLPWIAVALAARFPGDFTLSMSKKGAPRKGLALGWMFLAIYAVFAFVGTTTIGWQRVFYWGFIPGVLFFVAAMAVQQRRRIRPNTPGLIALALFSVIYGYGLVHGLNIVLDHSTGTAYPAVVLQRYSKGPSLQVAPWGPIDKTRTIPVTYSLYHSVKVRDRVCMALKEGALGMPWYSAQACPWNGKIELK